MNEQIDYNVRLIAFYLPQFHPIPENDVWWGKGFTEWTACVLARPRFEGHYQPRISSELGFYDLRLPEIRDMQASLAKEHGIFGFCYWHYWFNGKLLLEKPFEEILKTGEPDFPFCLAWANENWTRRWDGLDKEILQKQEYGGYEDDKKHFEYLLPAWKDKRSIKINDKPLFLIYRPKDIPDVSNTINRWKEWAQSKGLPGLYIVAIRNPIEKDKFEFEKFGFDGELIFQPDFYALHEFYKDISKDESILFKILNSTDIVIPYDIAWPIMAKRAEDVLNQENVFPCVIPSWDNTPRRKKGALVLHDSSPEIYAKWLDVEIKRVINRDKDKRIVFINAWNEWGEGNYLEPDLKFGRGYLNATKDIVERYLSNDMGKNINKKNEEEVKKFFLNREEVFKQFIEETIRINRFLETYIDDYALLDFYKEYTRKLEKQIMNFYLSRGGKLLLKYYRWRDKLFPEDSKRRKILSRIFSK
ncbi:MAG TPA: glycoside hydrolase family 99-like domain-containing protein [Syntrophorhabdaceae bacterium]|nr:glycoside hydrolase family 99-like domain-containing protein [Syntrophorhabdaceae bacterium]HQH43222.1 glycoside hydrolase family 99-like domain-containing protein [Syntrophorhabdaceae bacterium]HQK46340.1 glycoside hydrolase family 99-like domain-containing protein [Syntrophorhabdaceae bacterium]